MAEPQNDHVIDCIVFNILLVHALPYGWVIVIAVFLANNALLSLCWKRLDATGKILLTRIKADNIHFKTFKVVYSGAGTECNINPVKE